jgi:hypothetical protein
MRKHQNMTDSKTQSNGTTWGELETVIAQVWGEIDQANRKHDGDKLLSATERLRRLNALQQQHQRMRQELQVLSGDPETRSIVEQITRQPTDFKEKAPFRDVASAKAHGEQIRTNWVEARLKESHILKPLRGTLYRNSVGDSVGIAYGMENARRVGRWFLGLPEGSFQNAVLLCDSAEKGMFSVCLPKDFLDTHHLRTTIGPQVKFNVDQRNGRTYLRVQNTGLVEVTGFINKYAAVL